ncbi:IS3 family transposase [Amycolatopsis pretoriensis]|uniref:IS3 family transposase n=1 Tax=Amycolatopsis pretoriensis TaxID=218821 RepID=UPI000A3BCB87|nr:IS3 family transposase [Amycolatopsis pretoriensis]
MFSWSWRHSSRRLPRSRRRRTTRPSPTRSPPARHPTGCWRRRSSTCTRTPRRLRGQEAWAELNRHGVDVARCTVERLMRETGLRGLLRDKGPRTTRPAADQAAR